MPREYSPPGVSRAGFCMPVFNCKSDITRAIAKLNRLQKDIQAKVRAGFQAAKPEVKAAMEDEMRRVFKVRRGGFAKTWRVSTSGSFGNGMAMMRVFNIVPWMDVHITGAALGPRSGRAVLIPLDRMGSRITTKKFYQVIDYLMQNKLTVIKHDVVYMKPELNQSRRGGVAAGSRVTKAFRARMPKGLAMALNSDKLVPIALIRSHVTLRARFNLKRIGETRLRAIVARHVQSALNQVRL